MEAVEYCYGCDRHTTPITDDGETYCHHCGSTDISGRCEHCDERHDPGKCCDCGASAVGEGRFAYLCADHAYEAYEDERADRG